MVKHMRNSSLFVALNGSMSELSKSEKTFEKIFLELFEDTAELVSKAGESLAGEFIYEIKTPVFNEEELTKDFFGSLEVLFDELIEFDPYFTQFRRVD